MYLRVIQFPVNTLYTPWIMCHVRDALGARTVVLIWPIGKMIKIRKRKDYGIMRTAFKFGRRVHIALRRKMLKLRIARLPAILLDLVNRPSGEKDCT